jgi:hypothetical protein
MQWELVATQDAYGFPQADLRQAGKLCAGAIALHNLFDPILVASQEDLRMVASNRIHCTVVAVEVSSNRISPRRVEKDLLPWADPYVAQLIRKLQDEVRQERQSRQSRLRHVAAKLAPADLSTSRRTSAAK